jgi:hypothetical protein
MSDEMKKKAASNEMRELYKKNNLCLLCVRKDARTMMGNSSCFDCFEAARERRSSRRQNKQCTKCGNTDERTISGKAYCSACDEKRRAYQKRRIETLRAEKKCVVCGVADGRTIAGKWRCARCQPKRKPKLDIPRSEYTDYGLCYFCGAPAEEGILAWDTLDRPLRVCEKHHQTIAASNKKWQTKKNFMLRMKPPMLLYDTDRGREAYEHCKKSRFRLLDSIARQLNEKLGCEVAE